MIHVLTVPGADPERDACVQKLKATASGQVCVHADPERQGILYNFEGALTCSHASGQRWSVIVADDAVLLKGWERELPAALHYSPSPILGLTHFGSYGVKLAAAGFPYGLAKNAVWGGAIGFRWDILRPLLNLVGFARSIGWNKHGDDGAVCAFNHIRGGESALAARAVFGQEPFTSLLGHSNRANLFPRLTIEHRGPKWNTFPPATRLHTRSNHPDTMKLVDAWHTERGGVDAHHR